MATGPISLELQRTPVDRALRRIAALASVEIAYSRNIIPTDRLITLRLNDVSVKQALDQVLAGTDLAAVILDPRQIVVVTRPPVSRPRVGTIIGRVTDARSGTGVSGASVMLEGTRLGTTTGSSGRYRIDGVPAGTHNVVVEQIGYTEARRSVEVNDGAETTADFALDVSALPLDEVVVTGSITESRVREVAVPVSIVTAEEIQRRGIERIDQLFRGVIPGMIGWDQGSYDYYSEISIRGKSTLGSYDVLKVFLDGVEMANHRFIATIDPTMIERVEVIRGPQASTLYGSDALSGVVQIFTKKGAGLPGDRPQVEAKTSAGVIESDFAPERLTLRQEHSLQITGGRDNFTYHTGGNYRNEGEWVPSYHDRLTSLFGGVQAAHGNISGSLSLRYVDKASNITLPILEQRYPSVYGSRPPTEVAVRQQTMGLTVDYQATPTWRHHLTLGQDGHEFDRSTETPSEAGTYTAGVGHSSRTSARYNTSVETDLGGEISSTLTGGLEYARFNASDFFTGSAVRSSGALQPTETSATRDVWSNSGYFAQVKVGVQDALFLTAGLRAERHDNFGEKVGHVWVPRIGGTYTYGQTNFQLKMRAAWGKSIRPPQPGHRIGRSTSTYVYLPNPSIRPEKQVGWEAGVDLHFGTRGSLSVTYYDQTADDLIDLV